MNLEIIGISVLMAFLFGYIMVGAIDFGASFFNAYSLIIEKEHILTNIIQLIFVTCLGSDKCFPSFLFCRDRRFFSSNGFLLWNNAPNTG